MSQDYIVSARKYRPMSFDTVVGQESLATTLKTAITSHRLAHAYLFCGPRGVGKTTCARIFAKSINCEHLDANGNPCNECESCKAFNEQRSFNIYELDAASNNGVDDIRSLIEQLRTPPQLGRYKVYIIDEVHMLSTGAFNAFLKSLEEPPSYAVFILATTEKHKILPTVLSRCQIYDFQRISIPDIVVQLKKVCQNEGITAEPEALSLIAQKADGGMRDALSIFDQVAASSANNITYKHTAENLNVLDFEYYFSLTQMLLEGNVTDALLTYQDIRGRGFDSQYFINGLAQHFRDLLVARNEKTIKLLEAADEIRVRYQQQATNIQPQFLYRALDLCNTCDMNYRTASNKQLLIELTLIKIAQLQAPTPPNPDGTGTPLKKVTPTAATQQVNGGANNATPKASASPTPQNIVQPQPAVAPITPNNAPKPQVAAGAPIQHLPKLQQISSQPPTPRPTSKLSFNVSSQHGQKDEEKVTTTAATTGEDKYTIQQLQKACKSFMEEHKQRRMFVNFLKDYIPTELPQDNIITLTVGSDGQKSLFEPDATELAIYLQNKLNNQHIRVQFIINVAAVQRILTPEDIFREIIQNNPKVNKFFHEYKLGIY